MNHLLGVVFEGIYALRAVHLVMYFIGGILIFLAAKKQYKPMLLLPIGFGAIPVGLSLSTAREFDNAFGVCQILFSLEILTEIFPVLIFVAAGAVIFVKFPNLFLNRNQTHDRDRWLYYKRNLFDPWSQTKLKAGEGAE
jgi:Na+-transporting methylmalonyl-CoA/oxaloacetate decarboxylase beta subunit